MWCGLCIQQGWAISLCVNVPVGVGTRIRKYSTIRYSVVWCSASVCKYTYISAGLDDIPMYQCFHGCGYQDEAVQSGVPVYVGIRQDWAISLCANVSMGVGTRVRRCNLVWYQHVEVLS